MRQRSKEFFVLSALLLCLSFAVPIWAESSEEAASSEESFSDEDALDAQKEMYTYQKSGSCGDHLTYELDDDGVLTISGTGAMWDYVDGDYDASGNHRPWYEYSVTKVVINDGVTTVGVASFSGFVKLTSVTIPDSVTSIGTSAFSGCTKLANVTVGICVTTIGDYAFNGCDGLTSVTIGGSTTSVGKSAFENCDGLTSVIISDVVTAIGDYAFGCCDNLTSVYLPDSLPLEENYPAFYATPWLESKIYIVSSDGVLLYYAGSDSTVEIPSAFHDVPIVAIGEKAFSHRSITSVTIPDSVTSIGDEAFYDCEKLTSAVIGDGVTEIGEEAFRECQSMTNVSIGSSVITIGDLAFEYCYDLTSVIIPDSVTFIGQQAFYYCKSLVSVTIGSGVTTMGGYAFEHCESLSSLTISEGAAVIGYDAFKYCSGLTSITIPESVTYIGGTAFYGCTNLTSATVYSRTVEISDRALGFVSSDDGSKVDGFVVCGYPGSTAENYAAENDFSFTCLHDYTSEITKEATCTETGIRTYTCTCGNCYTESIPTTGHKWNSGKVTKKATSAAAGVKTYTCKNCSAVKTESIAKLTMKFTSSSLTRAMGDKTFTNKLTSNTDGKITYKSSDQEVAAVNKTTGKVTIKGVGIAKITASAAKGTKYAAASKSYTLKVNPGKVTLSGVKNVKGKKMKVTWKKNTTGTGYQIQYSTDKNFKKSVAAKKVNKNKTTSATISKLKKGKKYYVRIRSYKKVSGKTYYSAWSSKKSVKIKK